MLLLVIGNRRSQHITVIVFFQSGVYFHAIIIWIVLALRYVG